MATNLPRDSKGNAIQALRPVAGGAQQITVGAASARNGTAFDSNTKVIGIYSTTDCFIELGDVTVAALTTDHFIPANVYFMLSVVNNVTLQTHIAAIQVAAGGTLYVSEFN